MEENVNERRGKRKKEGKQEGKIRNEKLKCARQGKGYC